MRNWLRIAGAGFAVVVVLCTVAVAGTLAYHSTYASRIYPGVSVWGIDVGNMTVEEASTALAAGLPDPAAEGVALRAGKLFWRVTWADAGRGYDYAATAQAAFQINRNLPWHARILPLWLSQPQQHTLDPVIVPADSARVAAILNQAAPLIAIAPVDAQLLIGPGGPQASAGVPGRALDVEGSTALVMHGLAEGAGEVELAIVVVSPRLEHPEPALTQARAMLAQPFTLVADDPVTEYHTEFSAQPERIATWLRVAPVYATEGASMTLDVDGLALQAWLEEIAPQLGPERSLDIPETLQRSLAALATGERQAQARIRHPDGAYTVQPGDTFYDIAYSHGFPQWYLEEANPDVDPDALAIGMELVIPSVDLKISEPVVPGKRIEISLPEQRLRAYESDALLFDFRCSSGMSTTPTIAGLFQVLIKEHEAFAQRWDLTMPYFLGIYKEGPDFYNGIHELPITAAGRRLWAGVLGWPASFGCIILDIGDAERLYQWAPVGTLVRITGVAPGTPTYEERVAQETQEAQETQPEGQ